MRALTILAGCAVAIGFTSPVTAQADPTSDQAVRLVFSESAALPVIENVQGDPADSLYRQGRRALNQRNYRDAARRFRRVRSEYPTSEYVGDSYYFEAFALARVGSARTLDQALQLLDEQRSAYPSSATARGDAPALRVQIEGALAQRGDQDAARKLQQQASSPCDSADQELRAMALNALMNMNSERAMPILREVLQNRDECSVEMRRQAVFLVSQKLSDESVDLLLDLAHRNPDPDSEVREQAVFWLSQVGTDEAAAALIDILRTSDDENLQGNAIFALSQHPSDEAWDVMREYAERDDVSGELRQNAIFWLSQNPRGGDYLRDLYTRIDDPELRANILFGIAQGGDEADGGWLLERALDASEDMEVRTNALFWAGQVGMEVDQLSELYDSVDEREMKEQVIFVLSQSPDRREALTQLMEIAESEEDAGLKQNAIFWIGQGDDPRVEEFLLRIIRR